MAERITRDLRLEPSGKWVLCGSLGTGKSSELVHLGNKLWRNWMVIALDLPSSTARIDQLTPVEVLFLIGAAAVVRARQNAVSLPDAIVSHLTDAFLGIVQPDVRVNAGDLIEGVALFLSNIATGGNPVAVGASTGLARFGKGLLGGTTRPVREGEPQIQALATAVEDVFAAIRQEKHLGRQIVLVDGLDGSGDRRHSRALHRLSHSDASANPHCLYRPITLMLSAYWNATSASFKQERLTNVVVRQAPPQWLTLDDAKISAGRLSMRLVIEKRLRRLNLNLNDVFEPAAVEDLITNSGGVFETSYAWSTGPASLRWNSPRRTRARRSPRPSHTWPSTMSAKSSK